MVSKSQAQVDESAPPRWVCSWVQNRQKGWATMTCRSQLTKSAALAIGAVTCAIVSTYAAAQDVPAANASADNGALSEIIVTAERRAESTQSLPIAITAFSGEQIERQGILNTEDLRQIAPSFTAGDKQFGAMQVSMRGVSTALGGSGANPSIALGQNGIYYGSIQLFGFNLLDVNRVEVLRGPQGTISGRNATAGTINIISNSPTQDLEGYFKATYGSFGRFSTEGVLNGPIAGDSVLGRLAVQTNRSDGWLLNTTLNQKLGALDDTYVRGSLRFNVGDSLRIDLIGDHMVDRGNPTFTFDSGRARPDVPSLRERFNFPGLNWENRTIQLDDRTYQDRTLDQLTAIATLTLSPSATITSTTGYVGLDKKFTADDDGTPIDLVSFNSLDPVHLKINQFSQELTLTADLSDRIDFIVGGMYTDLDINYKVPLALPFGGLPFNASDPASSPILVHQYPKLRSISGYTQWRYKLTDKLRLTAGARYTSDSTTYREADVIAGTASGGFASAKFHAWTPRFSVDYEPTNRLTLYTTVSRGYKGGGFNTVSNEYLPETVWSYEVGAKAGLFDNRLRAALSGFYMDYKNMQQVQVLNVTTQLVTNAASSTIKGLELELNGDVNSHFQIGASATYLDAKYNRFVTQDALYPELGLQNVAGNRLVRAPKLQLQGNASYSVPVSSNWNTVARVSYAWQSRTYYDYFNNPLLSQGSYAVINGSLNLESADHGWEASVFVTNLTDKLYWTTQQIRTESGAPGLQGTVGDPRMFGVSVQHRF
jgi:iron complex outermembrane receptor protein